MTITPQLYTEINDKLVAVLEEYKDEISQYEMLVIGVNLLVSYMEVIIRFDQYPRDKLLEEVLDMVKTSKYDTFTSRN